MRLAALRLRAGGHLREQQQAGIRVAVAQHTLKHTGGGAAAVGKRACLGCAEQLPNAPRPCKHRRLVCLPRLPLPLFLRPPLRLGLGVFCGCSYCCRLWHACGILLLFLLWVLHLARGCGDAIPCCCTFWAGGCCGGAAGRRGSLRGGTEAAPRRQRLLLRPRVHALELLVRLADSSSVLQGREGPGLWAGAGRELKAAAAAAAAQPAAAAAEAAAVSPAVRDAQPQMKCLL